MNHPSKKAAATLPLVRCAIYTRKSTEEGLEQEFNSLDAQRESAEAFIRSHPQSGPRRLDPLEQTVQVSSTESTETPVATAIEQMPTTAAHTEQAKSPSVKSPSPEPGLLSGESVTTERRMRRTGDRRRRGPGRRSEHCRGGRPAAIRACVAGTLLPRLVRTVRASARHRRETAENVRRSRCGEAASQRRKGHQ
jgi:hypothetical protein